MARTGRPKKSLDVQCRCKTCGKEYAVPEWQDWGRDFCGRPCYFEHRRKNPVRNFVEPETKICPSCGTAFLVRGKGRRPARAIHCSRVCAGTGRVRTSPARIMDPIEAAWLAGVFDGEGNIAHPRKGRPGVRLTVNNTCEPFVQRILEVVATGSIFYRPSKNPRHSDQWVWQCHAENARILLRQMLPWLIVKREKAEEVLN